jgi:DNA-binding transcriptional LysR family regulator
MSIVRVLTPRQLSVVRAYGRTGSVKLAAAELGIRPVTARHALSDARERTGVPTSVQLVAAVVAEDSKA